MYILAAERDTDPSGAFRKYQDYLTDQKGRFPSGAYRLATGSWWFDFGDHNCPHDSWLERFEVIESGDGDRDEIRSSELRVLLFGAYHDRTLQLHYRNVSSIQMDSSDLSSGHGRWRYDEFRVSETGALIHEIERMNYKTTCRWIIEAEDIEFQSTLAPNAD